MVGHVNSAILWNPCYTLLCGDKFCRDQFYRISKHSSGEASSDKGQSNWQFVLEDNAFVANSYQLDDVSLKAAHYIMMSGMGPHLVINADGTSLQTSGVQTDVNSVAYHGQNNILYHHLEMPFWKICWKEMKIDAEIISRACTLGLFWHSVSLHSVRSICSCPATSFTIGAS